MKTLILNILLMVPVLGWGQTFEKVVDFNIGLSSLSNPELVRDVADDGRIVIIEGLLRDIIAEKTDTEINIWVTLIGGEWIGTSEVRAYSCRIKFSGNEWQKVFAAGDDENTGYVKPGSRMLVAARVIGIHPEDQVAELEMVDYRVFK